MARHSDEPVKKKRSESLPTLTLRVAMEQTAWLDSYIFFGDSGVFWSMKGKRLDPEGTMIAKTQRRLNMVRCDKKTATKMSVDFPLWLAQKRGRLEEAKFLAGIEGGPDLKKLPEKARKGDAAALERLAGLLVAEAVCINDLPISPCCELSKLVGAESQLESLALRSNIPLFARRLALMTLGALRSALPSNRRLPPLLAADEIFGRCYYWGMKYGVCAQSRIFVHLLANRDGIDQSERLIRMVSRCQLFLLEPAFTRKLLEDGISTEELIRSIEVLSQLEGLGKEILKYRDELGTVETGDRQAFSMELALERKEFLDGFRRHLLQALDHCRDSRAVACVASFTRAVLEKCRPDRGLLVVLDGLYSVEDWTEKEYVDYLRLLQKFGELVQGVEKAAPEVKKSKRRKNKVQSLSGPWLAETLNRLHFKQSVQFLRNCGDIQLVLDARRNNIGSLLHDCSPALARTVVDLVLEEKLAAYDTSNFLEFARSIPRNRTGQILSRLKGLLSGACGESRTYAECYLDEFAPNRKGNKIYGPHGGPGGQSQVCPFESSLELFEVFISIGRTITHNYDQLVHLSCELNIVRRNFPESWRNACAIILDHLESKRFSSENASESCRNALHAAILIAASCCEGEISQFESLLARMATVSVTWEQSTQLRVSVAALRHEPWLRRVIALVVWQRPKQTLSLLSEIATANRIWKDSLGSFAGLGDDSEENLSENWEALVSVLPDARPMCRRYLRACRFTGAAADLPASLLKILDIETGMKRELAYLESAESLDKRAESRCLNLRRYLSRPEELKSRIARLAADKLVELTAQAEWDALNVLTRDLYRRRLRSLVGRSADSIELDSDWFNAVRVWSEVDHNRRVLKRLLIETACGRDYVREHPGNVRFLKNLAETGISVDVWLSDNRRVFLESETGGERLTLYMESNPLKIMQMGNYVSTCLAVDGCNSFSLVPNACELNKRVIYAEDRKGRVVGRKLVAISSEQKLVGFRTYSWFGNEKGHLPLVKVFSDYCQKLAATLNIEMAVKGDVPQAICQAWYHDGLYDWQTNEYCY